MCDESCDQIKNDSMDYIETKRLFCKALLKHDHAKSPAERMTALQEAYDLLKRIESEVMRNGKQ